ncbi:MAG TPA: methyl-accepting chemotaxis protein, partial [Candidatus Aminicenantes bacterium]|nr:methyl-accepting chemotaxis protein [Candidatus Aminicenantes bacterium]
MDWYKNLRIGKKFVIAFLSMIIFIVAVGVLGIRSTREIHSYVRDMVGVRIPAMDSLIRADRDLQKLLVAERSMMFKNTAPAVMDKMAADYEEAFVQSKQRWEEYKKLGSTAEERAVFPKYEAARTEWEALTQRIVKERTSGGEEARAVARELSLGPASDKFEVMREYLNTLQEINDRIMKQTQQASVGAYSRVVVLIVLITFVAILAAISFWFLVARTITGPVREMVVRAQDLAEGEGDLTRRIRSDNRDELGELSDWFNRFLQQIHEIVARVKERSLSLIDSTTRISSGSELLAVRTNEQAASITETSTTLEEFTSVLKLNQDNSGEV